MITITIIMNQYTLEQVAQHNATNQTQWLAYNGCVYDVTSFVSQHPGGAQAILNRVGTNVTNVLEKVDAHMEHWSSVEQYLQKFLIGQLVN